jgi:hypothetical protein
MASNERGRLNQKSAGARISGDYPPPRPAALAHIRIIACRLVTVVPVTRHLPIRIRPDGQPALRANGRLRVIAAGTGTVGPVLVTINRTASGRLDIEGGRRRNLIDGGRIRVMRRVEIRPVIRRIPIRKTEIETESRRPAHTPVTPPVRESFPAIYR